VDVAGAGGTSWAGIESYRGHRAALAHRFWDWGIPTAECIQAVRRVPGLRVIASGGIEDGVTMAKALALGAELCGSAQPLLKRLLVYKKQGLARLLQAWREELKTVLFLTGCRNVGALRSKPVLRNPGSVVSP
jgi:isopentenyl-diphosphate delta-isomerase